MYFTNRDIPELPRRRQLSRIVYYLIVVGAVVTTLVHSDVINLTSGRQIVARITHQDASRVYFERCGIESSVPWKEIVRIDSFSDPASESARVGASATPGCGRAAQLAVSPQALAPVVKNDVIDEAYLAALDARVRSNPSAANRRVLADAYVKVSFFLTSRGDPGTAVEKVRHALGLAPDDPSLTLTLGSLYITQNRHSEAINILQPASRRSPKAPEFHYLLGSAYYSLDRLPESIEEWRKGLALRDDPQIREALARIDKEHDVTRAYQDLPSTHFIINYEAGARSSSLGREILDALEEDFRAIQNDLQFSPDQKIIVLLYPSQDFRDITRTPSWVGALNDGKIRVPISGLTSMTPDLARVLKHELTHSFVRQATLGRCPLWFNEGLAQLEEGASTEMYGKRLVAVFDAAPRYSSLQRSFISMGAIGASIVYAKSLAALEYLRDTQGLSGIRHMLGTIATNADFDAVLQLELRVTYPMFEKDVSAYLNKRYGS